MFSLSRTSSVMTLEGLLEFFAACRDFRAASAIDWLCASDDFWSCDCPFGEAAGHTIIAANSAAGRTMTNLGRNGAKIRPDISSPRANANTRSSKITLTLASRHCVAICTVRIGHDGQASRTTRPKAPEALGWGYADDIQKNGVLAETAHLQWRIEDT